MDRLILGIAILPTILLWKYVNKLDKHKEPTNFLVKLFFGGILSLIVTLVISFIISLFIPDFFEYEVSLSLSGFLYSFLGIGLVEEFSKFIMMYSFSWNNKNLDETYDVILYTMIVALGFATGENLLYSIEGGVTTAIVRFFTAVPGHVVDGAFMGYFLCLYRINPKRKEYLILAIFLPALLHGVYDFIAFTSETIIGVIVFIAFVITEFIIAKRLIKSMAKNSRYLEFPKISCSNCGQIINTRYCPNCGKERE